MTGAQEWSSALADSGRVEIGLRRGRLVFLLLISVLFTLIGLGMGLAGPDLLSHVLGWVAVVFFGFGGVYLARQLFRRGPAVVVDATGIASPFTDVTIPWTAARGATVFSSSGTDLVQVEADQSVIDAHYAEHAALARTRAANRKLMGGIETLSLASPLAVDASEFAGWLDEEIRRRSPR